MTILKNKIFTTYVTKKTKSMIYYLHKKMEERNMQEIFRMYINTQKIIY